MDSVIRIPFGNSNTTDSAPRRPRRISDPKLIRKIRAANGRAKRVFDILVAASAMIFLLPALITIALAVKLGDGGPILYRHRRVGRQGQRFDCLKFRSMAVDSEQRLARLLLEDPHAAQEWQAHQKLNNDPRVTALGNFLRKTSLDELPQLWNVLVGEMSLIGPRPVTRAELNRYGRDRRYYLLVRPGLTGLWQVSGRSSTGYERRIIFDRQYLERWSWPREIWILLMTIPAVLRTKDAC